MMMRNSRETIDLRLRAARPLRKAVRQDAVVCLSPTRQNRSRVIRKPSKLRTAARMAWAKNPWIRPAVRKAMQLCRENRLAQEVAS